MKKILLILVICFFGISLSLAAPTTLNTLWVCTAGNPSLGQPSLDTVDSGAPGRGMGVANTGNIIVTSRKGGSFIYVMNALDGTTTGLGFNRTGQLDNSLITGGTHTLCKLRVAADGAIYANNLTTNILTNAVKIYRWADETSACTVIYNSAMDTTGPPVTTSARRGDSFTVTGSGANTQVYLCGYYHWGWSGALDSTIYISVFTTNNGTNFMLAKNIFGADNLGITSTNAAKGMFVEAPGGDIYCNNWMVPPTKLNQAGAVIDTMTTYASNTDNADIYVFTASGRKYLAQIQANAIKPNGIVNLYDITYGSLNDAVYKYTTDAINGGAKLDGNSAGMVAWDPVRKRLIGMSVNNGVGVFDGSPLFSPTSCPIYLRDE